MKREEVREFVGKFIAENPGNGAEVQARKLFGNRVVDFALTKTDYILWSDNKEDHAYHNGYDVYILLPQYLFRYSTDIDIYNFCHEIGHLIPFPFLMDINMFFYRNGYLERNLFLSRVGIVTEIIACFMGYYVMWVCGVPFRNWKSHLSMTVSHYWEMKPSILPIDS